MQAITSLEMLFQEGKPFPPSEISTRNKEYAENKSLRADKIAEVWEDELRLMREDNKKKIKLELGYFRLSVVKTADTMLGQPPIFNLPKGAQGSPNPNEQAFQDYLTLIDIGEVLKEVEMDQHPLGTGLFKIYVDSEGEVRIQANCPDCWIPVTRAGDLRDVLYHVLYSIFKKMIKDEEKTFLKAEIHDKNSIEHRVYALASNVLEGSGYTLGPQQDIADFEEFAGLASRRGASGAGLGIKETHGLGEALVIPAYNIRFSDDVMGEGSFTDSLKSVCKNLIEACCDVRRVNAKHTDPDMIAPMGYTTKNPVTGKQEFRAGGRIFQYRHDPGMSAPDIHYLEPTGTGVVNTENEINRLKRDFWALAELPPAALANETGLAGESGTALRLRLFPLTSLAGRLRESLDPSARKALRLACKLKFGIDEPVSAIWKDGLPKIPLEASQEAANKKAAGWSTKQILIEEGYSEQDALQIGKDGAAEQGI